MIALLLDEVSQWTMIGRMGKMGLTREITVRYLRPVPTGTDIIVEARIGAQDEKSTVLHSAVRSMDNVLLAEGESRWTMAKPSTIAKVSKLSESQLNEFLAEYPVTASP